MVSAVIIGGGISGLAAAYTLAKAGRPSVVIEAQARLGGVIETKHIGGCVIEGGPDSFLAAKPQAAQMARELGLGGDLISSNDHERVTYILRGGRMVPMPDGLMMMVPTKIGPLVRTPLLSLATKARMGLEYFRRPNGAAEDRSVADFIRDHYGQETVDYLAEPLLSGVYGGDPSTLSVRSVLARFSEIESKYGSLTRGVLATMPKRDPAKQPAPLFQTLREGLGGLIERLRPAIAPHATIRTVLAETVERHAASGWRVRAGGEWLETPHVIVATPAHAAAALLQNADSRLAELLGTVGYTSSITLALGYRRGSITLPKGFGFLIPRKERRRLLACTFVHNKFSHRAPQDVALLRCFLTGEGGSDEELVAAARSELADLLDLRAEPAFSTISRWPRSMAQYGVGHGKRLEEMEARTRALPGLFLAGNAYRGIGIPDCIESGSAAAKGVLNSVIP